ncbi:TIGR02302 family protein [Amorphus coralli]|uniref:TIGR02302 family protein n=1 Tax=Amorphus coralli TaxID=340680 RepID=UPI000371BDE8|nr:TIGR02302 family protein [Amorphus coralli]
MTDPYGSEDPIPTSETEPAADPVAERVDRLVRRARLSLLWEKLWPALALPLGVIALFLALSWLGLWLTAPAWLRLGALVVFGAGLLAALVPLARLKVPSRREAVHRLERQSGVPHRPLTAFEDGPAVETGDPGTQALWVAHRARMVAALERVSAKLPSPRLYRRDPYALRAVVGILLFLGIAAGSGEYWSRIKAAFVVPPAATTEPTLRLDAWVSPPAYTGRAPLFLTGAARPQAGAISVPVGSELVLRVQGAADVTVGMVSGDTVTEVATAPVGEVADSEAAPDGPREAKVVLEETARIEVKSEGTVIESWPFAVVADTPPTIRFTGDPTATARGALELHYETADDYGVGEARAEFSLVEPPSAVSSTADPRPLIEALGFALALPSRRDGAGAARTTKDLSGHPWAGAEVEATLVAVDEIGQEARSEPKRFVLPARTFYQPVARAMIEQRRILAYDANAQPVVIDAISSLMLFPQAIFVSDGHYLAVDSVYRELVAAEADEELKEVLDALWNVAVMIEDGELSDAERALKAAQEALRQAIQNGASDEEIARLTQELRQAMNRYMRELAQQAMRNPQQGQQMDPNAQMLSQRDLDQMLSQIEELAKSGAREQAEQLLSEMQRMMENLQAGQQQMMPQGGMGEMEQMLDQLGKMIQRQQELMNETHRLDRQRRNGGQPGQRQPGENGQQDGQGMSPQELAEQLRQLQESQGQLGQSLQELMDQLMDQGLQPNGQLGEAGDAMGRAENQLGQSRPGDAVGDQGEALDRLREGAQSLAQQMAGDGNQPGGNQPGQTAQGQERDPLGRFRRNQGSDMTSRVQIPDEIDVQRARRILEELRNRLSDPQRPMIELDYLERLLPGN